MKNCKAKRLQKMNPGVVSIVGMSAPSKNKGGQHCRNDSLLSSCQMVNIAGSDSYRMIAHSCQIKGVVSIVGTDGHDDRNRWSVWSVLYTSFKSVTQESVDLVRQHGEIYLRSAIHIHVLGSILFLNDVTSLKFLVL
jgi:hypothetical protein